MDKMSDAASPGSVHPSATVHRSARLGPDTTVGPHCDLASGVSLGSGVSLAANVAIGQRATIGSRTSIGPGASVADDVAVGSDVSIGPNAVLLGGSNGSDGEVIAPSVIGEHVSIGANASVLPGVTVHSHAAIGAGSVVTRDVPPYATAAGSPARIVGYQSSPAFTSAQRMRASSFDASELPKAIGRATLSLHPLVTDLRGSLSFGEIRAHLPFTPKRYFLVFDVPGREVRGEHAHRAQHQLLVCVKGECAVAVDDGTERAEVLLDRPDASLHLPPMVWASQYRYSSDAVLMVLASDVYDGADYIRGYDEFTELVNRG